MSETIDVANAGRSDLTLPSGAILLAGRTTSVKVETLRADAEHPSVRHWLDERILRPAEPILFTAPSLSGCDCADVHAKLAEAEDKLARATDLLAAERTARTAAETEVARLADLLAAKPSPSDEAAPPSAPDTVEPLVAKHRGGGSWSVMRGDVEMLEGLKKADADTFNAMSDEDKAAFVGPKA